MQSATPPEVPPHTPPPNPPAQLPKTREVSPLLRYAGTVLRISEKQHDAFERANIRPDLEEQYALADAWLVESGKRYKRWGQFMFRWLRRENEKKFSGGGTKGKEIRTYAAINRVFEEVDRVPEGNLPFDGTDG